ncbi:hypothetical protein ACJ41O_010258 [Fusarium nematophilum]
MSKLVEVDPSGDTLIILQKRDGRPHPPSTTQKGSSASPPPPPEVHFLVSKKHLASASRRAHKMFSGGFKEAVPEETDGLCHWKFEPVFDPRAFELVMKIIHGKTRDIPQVVTTELLAGIAAVVDDLECHDALWFFAKGWLNQMRRDVPTTICPKLAEWILISFVFEEPMLFEQATRTALRWSTDSMSTYGFPLRPKIIKRIEEKRKDALEKLIGGLFDLEKRLLSQDLGCSFGCRAMLLGALLQGLTAASLYSPRPSSPFPDLSIGSTLKSLRSIKSPKYYCTERDSAEGKHSGTWRLEQPAPKKSGGGGGLGGGFYNDPGYFTMPAELDGAPRQLVQHHCCLENLVTELASGAETAVVGLKLGEYL